MRDVRSYIGIGVILLCIRTVDNLVLNMAARLTFGPNDIFNRTISPPGQTYFEGNEMKDFSNNVIKDVNEVIDTIYFEPGQQKIELRYAKIVQFIYAPSCKIDCALFLWSKHFSQNSVSKRDAYEYIRKYLLKNAPTLSEQGINSHTLEIETSCLVADISWNVRTSYNFIHPSQSMKFIYAIGLLKDCMSVGMFGATAISISNNLMGFELDSVMTIYPPEMIGHSSPYHFDFFQCMVMTSSCESSPEEYRGLFALVSRKYIETGDTFYRNQSVLFTPTFVILTLPSLLKRIFGDPTFGVKIKWSVNNTSLKVNTKKLSVQNRIFNNELVFGISFIQSQLAINDFDEGDYGTYTCEIECYAKTIFFAKRINLCPQQITFDVQSSDWKAHLIRLNTAAVNSSAVQIDKITNVLLIIVISLLGVILIYCCGRKCRNLFMNNYYIHYMWGVTRNFTGIPTNEAEYEYDVFIAYSSANIGWVATELLSNLEDRRYKVFFADRDVMYGSDIIKSIDNAITKSRKAIVVISPDFMASNWCKKELGSIKTKIMEEGSAENVLILKYRDCRIDKFFLGTKFLDYTNENEKKNIWNKLPRWLGPPLITHNAVNSSHVHDYMTAVEA